MGLVVDIYAAPGAGSDLHSLSVAELHAGGGIVGDRYYRRAGTFSEKLKDSDDWQVTLIELEEIERFNAAFGSAHSPGSFRRNVVTKGIRLNDLVGRRFTIGNALLEGVRLCEPCAYLGTLLGPNVVLGMTHRAGLRARILTGASIRPGDGITDQR